MRVCVNECKSEIRALNADSVLAPTTFACIVEAVLERVREESDHQKRAAKERTLQELCGKTGA